VTPRQRAAFAKPATYADEVDTSERVFLELRGERWSTLLSVNK
jgi:hypothetical protein